MVDVCDLDVCDVMLGYVVDCEVYHDLFTLVGVGLMMTMLSR